MHEHLSQKEENCWNLCYGMNTIMQILASFQLYERQQNIFNNACQHQLSSHNFTDRLSFQYLLLCIRLNIIKLIMKMVNSTNLLMVPPTHGSAQFIRQHFSKSPIRPIQSKCKPQKQAIAAKASGSYNSSHSPFSSKVPQKKDSQVKLSSTPLQKLKIPQIRKNPHVMNSCSQLIPKLEMSRYKRRKQSQNNILFGYDSQHTPSNISTNDFFGNTEYQNGNKTSRLTPQIANRERKASCNLQHATFLKKTPNKKGQNDHCPQNKNQSTVYTPRLAKKRVANWDVIDNYQLQPLSNSPIKHDLTLSSRMETLVVPKLTHLRKNSDNENVKKVPSFLSNIKFHRSSVESLVCNARSALSLNSFVVVRQLGKGSFGRVMMAVEKTTKLFCAIKIMSKQEIREDGMIQQLIRQLKTQMFMNHPNIVKVYGFFEDLLNLYIIMECALDGHLSDYIKKSPKSISQSQTAFIFHQICSAVSQMHSLSIIHRDLKPQNVLIHEGVVKICDFGWSVYRGGTLRSTFCGTPIYLCPQILIGNEYDESIDIWALGVILYELLLKSNPFRITCKQELINIVNSPIYYDSNKVISETAKDIINRCLTKRACDRPSIRQLLQHEFLVKAQGNDDFKRWLKQ